MNFRIYHPAAGLHPYVKRYYYWQDNNRGEKLLPPHLLSLGDQYLVFLLQGGVSCRPCHHTSFDLPEAAVTGHFTCASQLKVRGPVKMVIVQLNPYGCHHLLGLDAQTFSNYYRNLYKLPDPMWRQLGGRLPAAGAEQVKTVLDHHLLAVMPQRSRTTQPVYRMVEYLQQQHGHVTPAALAARFQVSRPTLERIFLQVTGLSPRLLARMLRFRKAMHTLQQMSVPHWMPSMNVQGHYNESMFIQDHIYFSGQPPALFTPAGAAPVGIPAPVAA